MELLEQCHKWMQKQGKSQDSALCDPALAVDVEQAMILLLKLLVTIARGMSSLKNMMLHTVCSVQI